jgi:hypothetical protein
MKGCSIIILKNRMSNKDLLFVLLRKMNHLQVLKKITARRVPVAQACYPSYSGGRDQEDRDSKPAWANSL